MDLPKVSKILDKLNDIECINRGGCGISALALYRYFEKQGETKKLSIVFLYAGDDEGLYHSNLTNRKNGSSLTAPAHIIVKHGKYYMDSTGMSKEIKDFNHSVYSHEATVDELIKSVNTVGWNYLFDREEALPKIRKIVKVKLDEVKLFNASNW